MKKILFSVLALLVFSFGILFFNTTLAYAEEEDLSFGDGVYEYNPDWGNDVFLEYFATTFKNRRGGTSERGKSSERETAEYIAQIFKLYDEANENKFAPYNPAASGSNKYLQNFPFSSGGKSYTSNNVIITKKANAGTENPKTVIIGAHYDNVYSLPSGTSESNYKFEGAYDNGTGVTVLIDLLRRLSAGSFNFDITFIAFGAEEYGMKGSSYYVNTMNTSSEDILLMVNLDVIGAGDFLYLFCDDVNTQHQDFLFGIAEREDIRREDISLKAPPFDKNLSSGQMLDSLYYHIGLMSDNLPFLQKGVNCAFFFTYNWEYAMSESSENISILHMENDNFKTLSEKYENYSEYMSYVSDIVYLSLNEADFENIMISSFESKFDYSIFNNKVFLLCLGLGTLLLICGFVYFQYYKFKKEKIIEAPEEVSATLEKIAVFGDDFEDKN